MDDTAFCSAWHAAPQLNMTAPVIVAAAQHSQGSPGLVQAAIMDPADRNGDVQMCLKYCRARLLLMLATATLQLHFKSKIQQLHATANKGLNRRRSIAQSPPKYTFFAVP